MFRLALSLGCTVKELSNRIDSRELTEWIVYCSIEPFGSPVEGYRDALTCATIANAGLLSSAPKLLKTKPFHPKDFMVGGKKDVVKQTWEQQRLLMDKNMITLNTSLKNKKKGTP